MGLSIKSFVPGLDLGWDRTRATCAYSRCHNKQLMKCIPHARPGIRVGQLWYCSVDCFAMASEVPLAQLSTRRPHEIRRIPRLSIGLLMLQRKYLTAEQFQMALAQSHWSGEELEDTLIRLGFTGEKQITAARAAQWGYPVLSQEHIGHEVAAEIPRALLESCAAVPLHHSVVAKRILLGFTYRVEHSFLAAVEQMTRCRPEPCFICPTDFKMQMGRLAAAPDYQEIVIDDPGTPERMSRTIGRQAVEVGATEAGFTRCKNSLWVRLSGKRGKTDVIFQLKNSAETVEENSELFEDTALALG